MKKYRILSIYLFLFCLCACNKANKTDSFHITDVCIYYGMSSYAMFGADQQITNELAGFYSTLEVVETDNEIDIESAYHVTFGVGKSFWMDKNGVIWLDGEVICYKKVSGTMDYDRITEIYEGSKTQ